MSLFVSLLFCFMVAVLAAIGDWTAVLKHPAFEEQGAIASTGSRVYTATDPPGGPYLHVYDVGTDVWAALPSQPPATVKSAMAAIDSMLYLSIEPNSFYAYNIGTDVWAAKLTRPSVQGAIATTDGTDVYLHGTETSAYKVALDIWSTLRTMPVAWRDRSGFTYYAGSLYVLDKTPNFHRYSIATDAWVTLASVTISSDIEDALVSACDSIFYLRRDNSLRKYQIDTDVWTLVSLLPTSLSRPLDIALVHAGTSYIFHSDESPTAGYSAVYEACIAPVEASVVGDPEFTTFLGAEHHLDLRPGVFNIVTTSTLAVNIMVDALPNVPPESDQVVVMVGFIALLSDCVLMVTCAVQQHLQVNVCAGRYVSEDPSFVAPSTPHWTQINHGALIQVGDVVVKVVSSHTHWICPEGDPVCQQQQHLDVYVKANSTTARSAVGLLADLDTLGRSVAQERLSLGEYETEGGLLALAVPATAGHLRGAERVAKALLL